MTDSHKRRYGQVTERKRGSMISKQFRKGNKLIKAQLNLLPRDRRSADVNTGRVPLPRCNFQISLFIMRATSWYRRGHLQPEKPIYWRKFLPQLYAPKGKWLTVNPPSLSIWLFWWTQSYRILVGNLEAWVSSLARSREGFLHEPPSSTFGTDRPAEAP